MTQKKCFVKVAISRIVMILLTIAFLFTACKGDVEDEYEVKESGHEPLDGQVGEVPDLTLLIDGEEYDTVTGGYNWRIENVDGTTTEEMTDCLDVPFVVKDQLEDIDVVALEPVQLIFDSEPVKVTGIRWDISFEELKEMNVQGLSSEEISNEPVTIEGGWLRITDIEEATVYSIKAEFEQGTLNYAFAVNVEGTLPEAQPKDSGHSEFPQEGLNFSDIGHYFDKEIISIVDISEIDFGQSHYVVTTENGAEFGYNPEKDELITLGVGPTKHNNWRNIVSPVVRRNEYFRDYGGGSWVAYKEYDGFTYYRSNDRIHFSNEASLLDEDKYVDQYNRIRNLEDIKKVENLVSDYEYSRIDVTEELIAYEDRQTGELILLNRETGQVNSLGDYSTFFRLSEGYLLYEKAGENPGLYTYKNKVETKILDYMILDAVYIEGILYYLDVDLQLYRMDDEEPTRLSNSEVMEHVFDDQFLVLTQKDDNLHVVYELIDEELAFVRCLPLETFAYFDWYFCDGEEFYYNGSYEISNTFSTKLEQGQDYGSLLYENDNVAVTYFVHYAYEFADSTLQIYNKKSNTYERVEDIGYIVGYRIEGDMIYIMAGGDWNNRTINLVTKIDLGQGRVDQLVDKENENYKVDRILDYSEVYDVKVINHDTGIAEAKIIISSISKDQVIYEETGDFEVVYRAEKGLYFAKEEGIFYYDFESGVAENLSGIKEWKGVLPPVKFVYEWFDFINEEDDLCRLNFADHSVQVLVENIKITYNLNNKLNREDSFCLDESNHLFYLGEYALKLSEEPVCSEDKAYHYDSNVDKVGEEIIFINLMDNQVLTYDLEKDSLNKIDLFWIKGEYGSISPALVDGTEGYYVGATSDVGMYEEYLVNDIIRQKQESIKEVVELLDLNKYYRFTIELLKEDIYLVGISETYKYDIFYELYNSKTGKTWPIEFETQMIDHFLLSGDELHVYYSPETRVSAFREFPFVKKYSLELGELLEKENYISLLEKQEDFRIGSFVNEIAIDDVLVDDESFTLQFGYTENMILAGGGFAPEIKIGIADSEMLVLTFTNLIAEDGSFEFLKELNFVSNYEIQRYGNKTYVYIKHKNVSRFTCELEIMDDGFVDARFVFK